MKREDENYRTELNKKWTCEQVNSASQFTESTRTS